MIKSVLERKILWSDLDALGIVFYPRYYEMIDAAGHLLFEIVDLNLGDLWRNRKILFALIETSCRYLKPGRYDQKIRIHTHIDSTARKTLLLKHSIRRSEDDVVLVEGYERRVCLDVGDPENFRAIPIPEDILAVFRKAMED